MISRQQSQAVLRFSLHLDGLLDYPLFDSSRGGLPQIFGVLLSHHCRGKLVKHFAVLIKLLRDRQHFLNEIKQRIRLENKIVSLLISSSMFLAVYGAIIGSSSSWLQMLSSAIKLPALYLITLIICLPTLYFFDILFGSPLVFPQYAALILTTVSVISVLLFSFAPITLFFLISIPDYNFFLLINIIVFSLTGIIGVKLFYEGMMSIHRPKTLGLTPPAEAKPDASETIPVMDIEHLGDSSTELTTSLGLNSTQSTRKRLLQFWLVLYGLVGSQLGWTLRPFFGSPGAPFQLFRPEIDGNFYQKVFDLLLSFLGF